MYHLAILGVDITGDSEFIGQLLKGEVHFLHFLNGKKGMLFSALTLKHFIEEEWKHDRYILTHNHSRSLRSYSSGEQKKALLKYLLQQNPDFIVLDHPFDALDVESRQKLLEQFSAMSQKTILVQLLKRKDDLLPFISEAIYLQNGKLVFKGRVEQCFHKMDQQKNSFQHNPIPPPCRHFDNIPDILIQFYDVSVRYGTKPVLDKINWTIKKGEFWELSGPNGSGKTTLLTMLTGDNPKAYGQDIMLFGRKKGSGESVWDIKEKIGYLTPAMVDLFKRRHTVEQMLISGMVDSIGLYKKPTTFELNLSKQWLQVVDIEHLARMPFIKLSQVQQRMVLILRAMVKHPPILILDEPSNGLDDAAASMLVHLINKVADESDTAIIYVSHRKEPGLKAHKHYLLMPGRDGSTGKIKS